MKLEVRFIFIFILLTTLGQLSGCGTVSGAAQGLSDDLIDLIKLSYKVF